jgi:predicted DNA-binding transcriptional regulator YafY
MEVGRTRWKWEPGGARTRSNLWMTRKDIELETAQETRRTARLLDLIWRISSAPRQWSRRRLADHYEVSERQITKDLDILRHGLRFPIQRSGDGYYFESVPRLPTATFSFEEALALLLAVRAGGRLAGVDGEALAAAVGRLESLFPRELRSVLRSVDPEVADPAGREERLAVLQAAIGQRRQVQIEYAATSNRGEVTERVVDPYAAIPYVKSWYLVGHCHLRGAVRLFKIDRIRDLRPLETRFAPPDDFDLAEFLARGWGIMRGVEGAPEEVVLRFRPPSANFVGEEVWHPAQQLHWEPNGSLLYRVRVVITPELQRWVYHYGRDVEVLAPDHLRKWVLAEAGSVAALGANGHDTEQAS